MKSKKLTVVLSMTILLFACGATRLAGQTTVDKKSRPSISRENYELAESRMAQNVFSKVKNLLVTPRWIEGRDQFWYPRQTADDIVITLVDAENGKAKPAFDHKEMVSILKENEVKRSASVIPTMSDLELSGTIVRFKSGGSKYEVNFETRKCDVQRIKRHQGLLVSPDGKHAIRTETGNLVLRQMDNGKETALTNDGSENHGYGIYYGNWKAAFIPRKRSGQMQPPMECHWAPDSRHLLVTKLDQRHVKPYPLVESVPGDGSFRPKLHMPRFPLTGEKPATLEWYFIDIENGNKRRVALPYEKLFHVHQDMLAIRKIWWSKNCDRMFAVTWGDNLSSASLYELDVATGEGRRIIHEQSKPRTDLNSTSYNPPNVRVTSNGNEAVWFSMRDGWGHLYLYDLKTGSLKNQITKGPWLVRDLIHVDENERTIYFTASGKEPGNPYFRYLYRVSFEGTSLKLLSPERADHMLTGPENDVLAIDGAVGYQVVSPSGKYVVYNYSTVSQPTRSAIRTVSDGSLVSVFEKADASALQQTGWQPPEEFVSLAADGKTKLYGVIYKPHDFDPEKSYPVVDSQYASPLTAVVPRNYWQALLGPPALVRAPSLAALGFVVVAVDARGTTYRSKEFSHYSFENLNTIGLEDHVAVIQQLGKTRPWMDLDRVGIHGGSYGGFTAFRAMLEFPDFFKVGVSNAGPASIPTMYPDYHWEAFHGRVKYQDGNRLRPRPTARPVNYKNNDATLQAKNLKGKLLIMLGELDENVPHGSTLALIDQLIKLDKDFDMLYVPNRPHNFRSAHTVRRCWDYLVRHLHQIEPPRYRIKSMN